MKIATLLSLILTISTFAQSENTDYFKYNLYRLDSKSENSKSQNKDLIDFIGLNKMDSIHYELKINSEKASFSAIEKLPNEQKQGLNFRELIISTIGEFYYDFKDSLVYNSQDFYGKNFNIEQKFNAIEWKFSSKEEIVKGYKCKIATFSNTEEDRNGNVIEDVTTVWYSDEVNSNSIPFGLTGLPGGIVKINFNGFKEAVLISQRLGEKNEKIKPLKKGKIVSLDEFEKMESEYSQKRDEMYRGNVDKD